MEFEKITYNIRGLHIFGFVLTTKKELEKTPITIHIKTKSLEHHS